MDPNGDITDAFDDADDLIRSVEEGQEGPWNDETAKFAEPELEELAAELQGTRRHEYQERRLRELQERSGKQKQPKPKAAKPKESAAPIAPWGDNLFEQGEWSDPDEQTPEATRFTAAEEQSFEAIPKPADQPEAHPEPTAMQPQSALVRYAPSLFAAMLVFVAVTVVHGLLRGWHLHLLVRAIAAMGVTGFLWQALQSGRLRATAIGAAVYGAAFVPSVDLRAPEHIFAVVLGLLVVVAGSGLIGVQRRDI